MPRVLNIFILQWSHLGEKNYTASATKKKYEK